MLRAFLVVFQRKRRIFLGVCVCVQIASTENEYMLVMKVFSSVKPNADDESFLWRESENKIVGRIFLVT